MRPLLLSLAALLASASVPALAQQSGIDATRRPNVQRIQRLEPAKTQRSNRARDLDRLLLQRDQAANRLDRIQKPLAGQTSRPANTGKNVVRTQ